MAEPGEPSVPLEVRLLGPLEVLNAGVRVDLPRSKKTRALLAYLAASGRSHSRTHLCSLLWESTDDPRGALRWSLSKLRPFLDDEVERLATDREQVALLATGARIDLQELEAVASVGIAAVPLAELEQVAGLVRGEFLEGFELPDQFEFQAWCIAQREQAREARCRLLAELVSRLATEPKRALIHARARVQADPFHSGARLELLELLVRAGRQEEARQQFEIARRLFRELDTPGLGALQNGWRALAASARTASPPEPVVDVVEARGKQYESRKSAAPAPTSPAAPLIGRRRELGRLVQTLEQSRADGVQTFVLVNGEPGIGKSRLAAALRAEATSRGVRVLAGRSFEAENLAPFGPWQQALGIVLTGDLAAGSGGSAPASRQALFQSVADAIAGQAEVPGAALLLLDDVQWLDRDSADLLHFVARAHQHRPLAIVLFARSGELEDNEAVVRMLRSVRREVRVERIELQPLTRDEIGELIAAPARADAIFEASAGNPLYALELERAGREAAPTSASLALLVRERIARLPAAAAEVLRWGAVLGHAFDVARLESLSALELNELIATLARLESHALLRGEETEGGGRYVFAHDLVREAVYGELSQPRRRLMHRQVVRLLAAGLPDRSVAAEVARHASLAGEAALGVRACLEAGLDALRAFANADAETFARRGLELVDGLDEAERLSSTLELLHLQYSARTPDREHAAARVQALAERALDLGLTRPARLGFQMLSFLRWESSSMADAHANILQAERVSRLAEPEERASALAQAARCFVLLERNLEQAEAFLIEAEQLTRRGARPTSAVPFATAMLHAHRGALDAAVQAFREARWVGREQGDRLAEFRAVEQWAMLELDRDRHDEALALTQELVALGERVRAGAESACARALFALAKSRQDAPVAEDSAEIRKGLDAAVAELRGADAKYELAFVLTRRARHEVAAGDFRAAREHAGEGLQSALAIGRGSEIALAHALLARCARETGESEIAARHTRELDELGPGDLAAPIRESLRELLPAGEAAARRSRKR